MAPPRSPLHWLLLACWTALLLVLGAPLVLGGNASIGAWLMQTVPLLLTAPGVLQLRNRALQWLAFLTLFYFANGVLQASSSAAAQRALGLVTVLLCVTLFTAVIVAIRRSRKIAHRE